GTEGDRGGQRAAPPNARRVVVNRLVVVRLEGRMLVVVLGLVLVLLVLLLLLVLTLVGISRVGRGAELRLVIETAGGGPVLRWRRGRVILLRRRSPAALRIAGGDITRRGC